MRSKLIVVIAVLLAAGAVVAQERGYLKAKVSFGDFKNLVDEVEAHRAERLVDLDAFLRMAQEPGTIVLDSRSKMRFDRIHLKGALHLNFADFTQASLAETIPSFDTRVLIYCNNNFEGNPIDFASKIALPPTSLGDSPADAFREEEKPIMMALNVPTYINLYGYGYRNVYELDELVDVGDARIAFEGSLFDESIELLDPDDLVQALSR